jgi:hypothetical protein
MLADLSALDEIQSAGSLSPDKKAPFPERATEAKDRGASRIHAYL